ncbi:hypothetical protein SteCoe_3405 [Stentor coeruleus]|uniref:EF-hand domain-containing protein n=1 Tax=Stentor coeruleus TaxID=5963 RepID=A0A1R2CX65_9CILI|nr:hypothetical protein SteCoe_3405 [Stentor coeruleus]
MHSNVTRMNATAKLPLMKRSEESRASSPRKVHSQTPRDSIRKPKEFPIKFLKPTAENRNGSMEAYGGSVGENARLDFYETYINLPQFSQRNQHQKLEDSPNLAYLGVVEKQKLKPNPFGIVRRKGPETIIDIHQYSMGDTYARAFSEGIKHLKNVSTLNLKANRLTDNGAAEILKTLESKQVKRMILSENRIGSKTITTLTDVIKSQECRLKVLELENTYISDKALGILCRILSEDKKLKKLSLAKNNLNNGSIQALVEMLKYNQTLKFLDLHWNCLGASGSVEFLEGLASNDGLVHIDLSYNSFGRKDSFVTANAFSKMFSVNQFLQHVDLSNNYFGKKECEIIGEGLKDNHNIYGLHVQGNDCVVDSKGYVIPLEYLNKTEHGHLHRRLLDTPRYKVRPISRINCWICEDWVEITITWKPQVSGTLTENPIFIHLDCDNYQQCQMSNKGLEFFAISRMVPPGMLKFFFSDSNNFGISKEYNTQILETPIKVEYPTQDGQKNYLNISKANVVFIEREPWNYKKTPTLKPRNDPRIKERTETILERIVWKIENSTFKDYRFDTEEFLSECADYDYEISNIKNIVSNKNEQDEIKQILKSHYKEISENFRQLSAISGIELFSISKNVLNEFLKKCSFEAEDQVMQECAILWNLSNAPQTKGEKYNAGNGLCRYEFAEFLVRLSITLYYKTKKCETIKESFEKMMNEHALPGMRKYDKSSWHTEKYLKEDVDHFLKLHKQILMGVFDKYSAMGKGMIDRMDLHEFRLMCNEAGLCNEDFVMREIDMCFRQAMMTEIDEIKHSEHLEMVYVEFVEALARIADQLYPDKNGQQLSLKKKLENLMTSMINICPSKAKAGWEPPSDASYHNMKYRRKVVVTQEYIQPK